MTFDPKLYIKYDTYKRRQRKVPEDIFYATNSW